MKTHMFYREYKIYIFKRKQPPLPVITSFSGSLEITRRGSTKYGTLPVQWKPRELNWIKFEDL